MTLRSTVEPLDLACHECRGRAGVLGVGVPGAAGQLRGKVEIPIDPEEGVGHARIVWVSRVAGGCLVR